MNGKGKGKGCANVRHVFNVFIRSMMGTAAVMVKEGGVKSLFSGLFPRTLRVTAAVFILSEAKERISKVYLHVLARTDSRVALALERDSGAY